MKWKDESWMNMKNSPLKLFSCMKNKVQQMKNTINLKEFLKSVKWELKHMMKWLCFTRTKMSSDDNYAVLNSDIDDNMCATSFDTNSIDFVLDNSANCHICNDRHAFTEISRLHNDGGIITVGTAATPEGIGSVAATWRDDDRRLHKINVEEVFYCPNSLVNLIGITKLGKQIENDDS